jgi:DNA-binding transcriptional MerR regulator
MKQDLVVEGLPLMLTTGQVAKRLGVSASTLCRWRMTGLGPRVYWLGPTTPRYREVDVLAWLEGVAA